MCERINYSIAGLYLVLLITQLVKRQRPLHKRSSMRKNSKYLRNSVATSINFGAENVYLRMMKLESLCWICWQRKNEIYVGLLTTKKCWNFLCSSFMENETNFEVSWKMRTHAYYLMVKQSISELCWKQNFTLRNDVQLFFNQRSSDRLAISIAHSRFQCHYCEELLRGATDVLHFCRFFFTLHKTHYKNNLLRHLNDDIGGICCERLILTPTNISRLHSYWNSS